MQKFSHLGAEVSIKEYNGKTEVNFGLKFEVGEDYGLQHMTLSHISDIKKRLANILMTHFSKKGEDIVDSDDKIEYDERTFIVSYIFNTSKVEIIPFLLLKELLKVKEEIVGINKESIFDSPPLEVSSIKQKKTLKGELIHILSRFPEGLTISEILENLNAAGNNNSDERKIQDTLNSLISDRKFGIIYKEEEKKYIYENKEKLILSKNLAIPQVRDYYESKKDGSHPKYVIEVLCSTEEPLSIISINEKLKNRDINITYGNLSVILTRICKDVEGIGISFNYRRGFYMLQVGI